MVLKTIFVLKAFLKTFKNNLYVFECSAYSNPGVSLSLYNTNTNKLLSFQNNTISFVNCNSNGIGCTTNISVSLIFTNSLYDNMTSVQCVSTSLNFTNIKLSTNITQNVAILQSSILKNFKYLNFFYFFFF